VISKKYKNKYVLLREIYNNIKGNLKNGKKPMTYKVYYSIIKNFFNILIRDVVHKLKLVHLPNRLGYIYLDKRPHRRPFHLRVDVEETNKTGEIVKYKVPILDDYYYKLVWNKSAKMVGSKILPLSIFKSEIKKIK
jgi:hypothetical protein|tara:strand:+ start:34765 stop:35172 length:408 start_codon:yes stop_codon:yes gene_type:complete